MPAFDLNDLYYYVQVVDHGGFAPAGRALGEPKSKLSRRIGLLEQRLGVRLIQRSTRRFSVTQIGQDYYRHCRAMLIEAEAAQEVIDLSRAEPRGTVRISVPVTILHARVGAMLADFMAGHPQVNVTLEATNRRVDVIGEGIDVAIRVRAPPLEDSDLAVRVLGLRRWTLAASPKLFERHALPQAPAELSDCPTLDMGPAHADHSWQLSGPDASAAQIHHRPRLVSDDMSVLRLAAVAGVGIAMLPSMVIADDLADGRLIRLLPQWQPQPGLIHAVFPSRRGLVPAVRQLLDYLALRFEQLRED